MAARGDRVVLVGRTRTELEQQAQEIGSSLKSQGRPSEDTVLVHPADVSDVGQVDALFTRVTEQWGEKWGPIEVLVNNAAVLRKGEVEEFPLADFDQVMAVNVRGSFLCAQRFFQLNQRTRALRGPGRAWNPCIVNLSSLGGIRGTPKFPGLCAYTTSKHAIIGLTESLAVEGKAAGIRVNCVAPGAVETRMLREAAPFLRTSTRPEDVAELIDFLCDPVKARSLNGAVLEVHSNE
jgi:3-oxoacyl-[acyl-carrier protein] reductase